MNFNKILLILFPLIFISIVAPFMMEGDNSQLGEEYGNIAESIVRGTGYANVFAEDSGTTAWMLPFNTWLFVIVFYLFGIKTLAAKWALLLINALFWTLSVFLLIKLCSLTQYRRYRFLVLPVFLLIVWVNPNRSLGDMMDVALVNFLSIASVYALYTFIFYSRNYIYLFILAVVLPLTSPGLFLAFALVIAAYAIHISYQGYKVHRKASGGFKSVIFTNRNLRICLSVGLLALMTTTLWGLRNYIVMDKFVLSKSNLWYEYYQANVADDDGMLEKRTFLLYHPNNSGQFLDKYLDVGEVKFMEHFKQLSIESFSAADYLQRVLNRLKFCFIYNPNSSMYLKANTEEFSSHDVSELEKQALLIDGKWIGLHLKESYFLSSISTLKLENREAIVRDWSLKRNFYVNALNRLLPKIRAVFIPLLPVISIFIGLSVYSIRKSGIFIISLITYTTLLLPYILISLSNRYIFFTQSLQAVFAFFVAAYLCKILEERFVMKKKKDKKTIQFDNENRFDADLPVAGGKN